MNIFHKRQGQMDTFNLYFFTQTIFGFRHLLTRPAIQEVVLQSLRFLKHQQLCTIYAFVLMPNHLHLLWRMEENDRKESAAASFSKFTAHQFKKYLSEFEPHELIRYQSEKHDRQYQFWKRDPLAIPITSAEALVQKMEYIHQNPVQAGFCTTAEQYPLSSAQFYTTGEDRFEFLTNVFE